MQVLAGLVIVLLIVSIIGGYFALSYVTKAKNAALERQNNPVLRPTLQPTAMPTVIVNASPVPVTNGSSATDISNGSLSAPALDYDDLLAYYEAHNMSKGQSETNVTPILTGDPALVNGVRIYDPSATPTPTATPVLDLMSTNRITPLRDEDRSLVPDSSLDAETVGSLAWDAGQSNVPSYMYQTDYPVFQLRFVSNTVSTIRQERVVMEIDKYMPIGGWTTLKYFQFNRADYIAPGLILDRDTGRKSPNGSPGSFTVTQDLSSVFTNGTIPRTFNVMGYNVDTSGRYRIQVWVYAPDDTGKESQACWISVQMQVLAKYG